MSSCKNCRMVIYQNYQRGEWREYDDRCFWDPHECKGENHVKGQDDDLMDQFCQR